MTRKSLKKILCVVSFIFAMGSTTPTHSEIHLENSRKQFVQDVIKSAITANAEVLQQRRTLIRLHERFLNKAFLPVPALRWISSTASGYGISLNLDKPDVLNNPNIWEQLQNRIDSVPFSLILAQAIYESDWGKSRFAREGHNYFGQRCFNIGCGIIPQQRNENELFEMRHFDSMTDSIRGYIHNLNTNNTYEPFRSLRRDTRTKNIKPDGWILAGTLEGYAEQKAYAKALQSIIRKYDLARYDNEAPQFIIDLSSVETHSFISLIRYSGYAATFLSIP